jgi:hypothetical protein
MMQKKRATSSQIQDADERAILLDALWQVTGNNSTIRDNYSDCPIDELRNDLSNYKRVARMTPEERLVDRWNSEAATIEVLDRNDERCP